VRVNREILGEYAAGSLWLFPGVSAAIALVLGWLVSGIDVGPQSAWAVVAFQGTADDARTLLIAVTGTVITVIALVLGLTVVALQLSSTQFSPRLLRNFIRDRPNQLVLSVFSAAFAYSAAGLYTVGVSSGVRTESYPRLAVTGALVLLFATLAAVIYFADHLMHSIQIDAIAKRVERDTLLVVRSGLGQAETRTPTPPPWAVRLPSTRSGYVQRVDLEQLLAMARRESISLCLRPRVGEHVVAGTMLAWAWRATSTEACPDPAVLTKDLASGVRIGFERTLEQDAAFGIRQLVDIACKALSPAVNDPYTAIQAIDHMAVIFCALAVRPVGDYLAVDDRHAARVIIPGRRFGDYLATMSGLIRRYGSREPTVLLALLRLLESCAAFVGNDKDRRDAIDDQAHVILEDAERDIAQPADVAPVRAAVAALHRIIGQRCSRARPTGCQIS
jgi:uncharacterized membrane protein